MVNLCIPLGIEKLGFAATPVYGVLSKLSVVSKNHSLLFKYCLNLTPVLILVILTGKG